MMGLSGLSCKEAWPTEGTEGSGRGSRQALHTLTQLWGTSTLCFCFLYAWNVDVCLNLEADWMTKSHTRDSEIMKQTFGRTLIPG